MGTIADQFDRAYRDYAMDGVPSSGLHEVKKSDVRAIGPLIEGALGAIGLSGLVATIKVTRAALDSDLAYAAGATALVYGDPVDANNDLYVKSGAAGAGSWSPTTIIHDILDGLFAASRVEILADAEAFLIERLQSVLAEIGTDLSDVTSATIGDLLLSGNNLFSGNVYFSKPMAQAGFVIEVSIGVSAAGTGQLMLLEPIGDGTYRVALVQAVTATGGANTWPIANSPYLPAGSVVLYKRLTGFGPYYTSGAGSTLYLPASSLSAVGDISPVPPSPVAFTISVQYTVQYAPRPLTGRLDAVEADIAELAPQVSIPAALLDGFDTSYLTGTADTGPGAADGSTLAAGTLRVIATPQYDTTYTALEFWSRIVGPAPELVTLRRDKDGAWSFWSRSGKLGDSVTATGMTSRSFAYSVPGGGAQGDTVVTLWTPGCRVAGDAVDTPRLTTSDPSTVSAAMLESAAQRPLVMLRGTYSQIADKGVVKDGIDAAYGKPAVDAHGLWFGSRSTMQRAQQAFRALMAGEADVIWEAYGDSNLAGSHTGDNGTPATPGAIPAMGTLGYTNARKWCDLGQFAALVSQRRPLGLAIPVTYEALMGQNNPQGAYTLYNPRCTSTGDFVGTGSAPTYSTLGGGAWLSDGTGDGSAFTYQPDAAVSRFLLGYYTGPGYGTMQYELDGSGTWVDISCATAAEGYAELAVDAGSLGIHALRLRRKDGSAQVAFSKIDAWNPAIPSLRILNCGFPGSTWLSWAQVKSHPWSPLVRMGESAAAIKSIRLGSNDIKNARPLSDILADAEAAIQACKRHSAVIVEACYPLWDDGAAENALQRQLQVKKGLRVARRLRCPVGVNFDGR